MSSPDRVTETCVLHIKPGIDFDGGDDSPGAQHFMRCSRMLKTAPGVIRQYWGIGVDEPHLFVHSVDWESPEHWHAFMDSEMIEEYMKGVHECFDMDKQPTLIAHTRWTSIDAATANLEAPLTIFSFFDIPDHAGETEKAAIEQTFERMQRLTLATAGGHGATHGFANDFVLTKDEKMEPKPGTGMIHGMWSYPSVEHHKKWEQSEDIKEEEVIFDDLKAQGLEMQPYKGVPGKHGSRMFFYVKFRPGA